MSAFQLPLALPKYLQKDELTQECKDVISSLPIEDGWVSPHLHQYKGFWITTRYMQGVLSFQKHFQAHETDILLATTPKVGATWLKAILYALVNRAHYPDPQKHPLLIRNPHDLVPFMEISVYSETHVSRSLLIYLSKALFNSFILWIIANIYERLGWQDCLFV
ncbi:Cytosolic sulfotransferase 11 [Morella rubra]|uniref:Sulfotransferase n=1 Tax=Morella rubra TaxID=262757 RepID=A0A6A1V3Y2_9ROSI|nr:Cytosolic sulfotransferase 11 [Morella rubra]